MGSAGLHTDAGLLAGRRRVLDALIEMLRQAGGAGALSHGLAVGRVAGEIGRAMDMADEQVNRLLLAGVLHDIGKTRISSEILDKPTGLTSGEWRQMHLHPLWGASILARHGFKELAPWVAAHHERPDGLGYPHGLAGRAIPLEARIIAVADAYEAMTGARPYRTALSPRLAVAQLASASGTQLDSDVVAAFLSADACRLVVAGET